jgi:hypothetical protein
VKTAIVIATSPGREMWVKDCLESIKSDVIVVSVNGYELGKIKWVYENTNLDKFVFLQDSVVIRDEEALLKLFEYDGSVCLMDVPNHMGSYLGIYERKILDKIEIPECKTKEQSILYEIEWTTKYREACDNFYHPDPEIEHNIVETVFKHGRENLFYLNHIYEKWKGTWAR